MDAPQLVSGEFQVIRELHGSVRVLVLAGELDMATTPLLSETLDGLARNGPVVLDLGELTFVDSHGLHTIFASAETLDLRLARPRPNVARLLKLTGGGRMVRIHETLEEALEAAATG